MFRKPAVVNHHLIAEILITRFMGFVGFFVWIGAIIEGKYCAVRLIDAHICGNAPQRECPSDKLPPIVAADMPVARRHEKSNGTEQFTTADERARGTPLNFFAVVQTRHHFPWPG